MVGNSPPLDPPPPSLQARQVVESAVAFNLPEVTATVEEMQAWEWLTAGDPAELTNVPRKFMVGRDWKRKCVFKIVRF